MVSRRSVFVTCVTVTCVTYVFVTCITHVVVTCVTFVIVTCVTNDIVTSLDEVVLERSVIRPGLKNGEPDVSSVPSGVSSARSRVSSALSGVSGARVVSGRKVREGKVELFPEPGVAYSQVSTGLQHHLLARDTYRA